MLRFYVSAVNRDIFRLRIRFSGIRIGISGLNGGISIPGFLFSPFRIDISAIKFCYSIKKLFSPLFRG
jgi:hypothetical protein